ncbi:hypothetical protein RHSIM_Rhsim13G0038300 [Rhododendron simsii]|uniref:DUF4283 domain-containing protein n=1 Tax=Rhododendron simsii TaxID=118357 RepID=A0A834FXQ1_RHOSS|nr:hypothetical protein RHSIM_Rhsim13G0038300 [Rhododendron simsii]
MDDLEILDLDVGSGKTGEVSNLCLVGKVLSPKIINSITITNVCTTAWKTRSPFSVTPCNNNVFLFRFEEAEDRELVLMERPWSVMNSLLVLRPVEVGVAIPDHDFSVSPFWVQIHSLPVEKMDRANEEIIGKRFQKLLAIETNPNGIILDISFLRVIRVEINLGLPIPKGFWLRVKSVLKKDLWISYKAQGVRRSNIPIEVIRHEVDTAEIRVAELIERRPLVRGHMFGALSRQTKSEEGRGNKADLRSW